MSRDNHDLPPKDEPRLTGSGFGILGNGARLIGRQTLAVMGLLMVILAIPIGFLTPFIPIGLPIGIFGSALLARNSVWGQRFIRHLLIKNPRLEKISPDWLLKMILGKEKTD